MFINNGKKIEREQGYYWVRIKRTKIWIIAKWSYAMQTWSIASPFENDTRGGFDYVYEKPIILPKQMLNSLLSCYNPKVNIRVWDGTPDDEIVKQVRSNASVSMQRTVKRKLKRTK